MRCPLVVDFRDGTQDCLKGKCAWWDKILKQCVVMSLLQAIRNKAVK